MRVTIELLRESEAIRKSLLVDGWRFDFRQKNTFRIRHPELRDERLVRKRLSDLGLLTSSGLRIEFSPAAESKPGGPSGELS